MITIIAGTALCVLFFVLWCGRFILPAGSRRARQVGEDTEAELAQLFVFISTRRLLGFAAGSVAVVAAAGIWLEAPVAALVPVCAVLVLLPRIATSVLRGRRQRRLIAQLPDALQLLSSLLKSGQGLMGALSQLTSRQPDPLGAELRLVLSECRLGVPLERAMNALNGRIGANDLRMLSTLLHTHRELGGNLSEAMERLASTLRARLAMEARIQSLTAQGRVQGVVVGLLPLFLIVILSFMEPAAMRALYSTAPGLACMAVIVTLEISGFLMIRRIVRVDV